MDYFKLKIFLILFCCSTALASKAKRIDSKLLAGRSEKEFESVQNNVRQIERAVLRKYHTRDETEQILADVNSPSFKNIQGGKIGDLLLTSSDAKKILRSLKGRKKRKIYNFRNHPDRKWSLPIKYTINTDSITNLTHQSIIEQALHGWEKETCVRFERITETSSILRRRGSGQYLYFTQPQTEGCNSYIGKADYLTLVKDIDYSLNNHQRQPIHLSDKCFDALGTVMHEIGHALGLIHEAQRLDRDQYIDVYIQNILYEDWSQFVQPESSLVESKGLPYDLGSMMHYSALAFSINEKEWKFTILPHNRDKTFVMGQRVEIGFFDARIINLAYCPVSKKLGCSNGGYTDPNNSTQCKCRDGWGGKLCTEVQTGSLGCSPLSGKRVHTASDNYKTFELYSPNYLNPVDWKYSKGDQCFWHLEVPTGFQFVWWLDHTSDHSNTSVFFGLPIEMMGCQFWLELKFPDETRGQRICGLLNDTNGNLTKQHFTHSHQLQIFFRTSTQLYLSMNDAFYRGFALKYMIRKDFRPRTTTLKPRPTYMPRWSAGRTTDYPFYGSDKHNDDPNHDSGKYNNYPVYNSNSDYNSDSGLSAGSIVAITFGALTACLLIVCYSYGRVRAATRRTSFVRRGTVLIEQGSIARNPTQNRTQAHGTDNSTQPPPAYSGQYRSQAHGTENYTQPPPAYSTQYRSQAHGTENYTQPPPAYSTQYRNQTGGTANSTQPPPAYSKQNRNDAPYTMTEDGSTTVRPRPVGVQNKRADSMNPSIIIVARNVQNPDGTIRKTVMTPYKKANSGSTETYQPLDPELLSQCLRCPGDHIN